MLRDRTQIKKSWVILLILSRINPEMGGLKGLLNPDQNWAESSISSYLLGQDHVLLCLQWSALSKKVLQSILWCPLPSHFSCQAFHRTNPNLCRTFCASIRWASLKLLLRESDSWNWELASCCLLLPGESTPCFWTPFVHAILFYLSRRMGLNERSFRSRQTQEIKASGLTAGNNPFAPHTGLEQPTGK